MGGAPLGLGLGSASEVIGMSTDNKIAQLRKDYLGYMAHNLDRWLACCESPIERLLLARFVASCWSDPGEPRFGESRKAGELAGIQFDGHATLVLERLSSEPVWLYVQPHVQLDDRVCRLDFAIVAFGEKLAIELDGHDFHERTKEQARRDKARDRALTKRGWVVIRYTGSEVYGDSETIYNELDERADAALDRAHAAWKEEQARRRT